MSYFTQISAKISFIFHLQIAKKYNIIAHNLHSTHASILDIGTYKLILKYMLMMLI